MRPNRDYELAGIFTSESNDRMAESSEWTGACNDHAAIKEKLMSELCVAQQKGSTQYKHGSASASH